MTIHKIIHIFLLHFLFYIPSHAQLFFPIVKDYFAFPILPGQQNFLAGNFGELRNNHFHCGIDIKTQYKTGLPVHAAADGFISKVSITTKGYGNTIFLTHPNGFVTVYAHLESLEPELAKIIRAKQYEKRTAEIEVTFAPNEITFDKGDIIAYSGNTGASGGPHLHFEIRDTSNNVYNPLLFGFKEIIDNIPPIVSRLAIRTFEKESRINQEFGRKELNPNKIGNLYSIHNKLTAWGTIGLEIGAYDRQNGTSNLNGVKKIAVYVDNKLNYNHEIDAFPFELASQMNAHIDYETAKTTGNNYQKCYVSDGNRLDIYDRTYNGKITIKDTLVHEIKVEMFDAQDNKTTLNFTIKGEKPSKTIQPFLPHSKGEISTVLHENTLKITHKALENYQEGYIFSKNKKTTIIEEYENGHETVYLYDLREGLPDSIKIGKETKPLAFKDVIASNTVAQYYSNKINLNFQKYTLYDTLYLQIAEKKDDKKKNSLIYQVNTPLTALYSELFVTLKPSETFVNKDKVSAYLYSEGGGLRYLGGKWNNDIFDFKTKYLGKYVLREDTRLPEITPISLKNNQIKFEIDDWPSGIHHYEVYINGKWVLFNYEHKKKLIWLDNPLNKSCQGELLLKVFDNVGNIAIYSTKIK